MARAPLQRQNAFDGDLPMADPEDASEGQPLQPKIGDRIMVVQQPWLDKIVDGSKTMELRCRKAATGFVWLGMHGTIYRCAKIVDPCGLQGPRSRSQQGSSSWSK